MRFVRGFRALAVVALVVGSLGCGSNTTTSGSSSQALINLLVTPSPIKGTIYSAIGPVYAAAWTTTISETAGLGGTIQFVRASIFDAVTGSLLATSNYDDKDLVVFQGTARVKALGTLAIPQQATYTPSPGNLTGYLTVDVQFKDDNGVLQETSLLVNVN